MDSLKKTRPFLTIITRCYKRPRALANNRASVKALTDHDLEQLFLVDETGLGLHRANQSLDKFKHLVTGGYVFILDDDDFLIRTDFIERLKKVVASNHPDLIMVKMISVGDHIIPDVKTSWKKGPVFCKIGTSCVVVKREIWQKHIKSFGELSGGDYHFIRALFRKHYSVYWLDLICSKVSGHGKGKPESGLPEKTYQLSQLAFVTMIHDRETTRLRRLIESLMVDQTVLPQELIVVDTSTEEENRLEVQQITDQYSRVKLIQADFGQFSKTKALNLGIRSVLPEVQTIGCVDVDFMFGPRLVDTLVGLFKRPNIFAMVEPKKLSEETDLTHWRDDWEDLCMAGEVWSSNPTSLGSGALQMASKSWWHKVRGYDEKFSGTLAGMDDDLRVRAKRDGLTLVVLPFVVCQALHQWHERSPFKPNGAHPDFRLDPPVTANLLDGELWEA